MIICIKKKKWTEKQSAFLISLLLTLLALGFFLMKTVYTGDSGLFWVGDSKNLIGAAFYSATDCSAQDGVDAYTFNGSTERFLRPNLPNFYIPFVLFCHLGSLIGLDYAMVLMYMAHLFVFSYYGQLLAMKYFQMKPRFAALSAVTASVAPLYALWYGPFFFASTLTLPLLYFTLETQEQQGAFCFVRCAFCYVLGFTTGYMPVSIMLCGLIFILSGCYAMLWSADGLKKQKLIKMLGVATLSGCVVILYYLQMLIYHSKVVANSAAGAISQTFAFSLQIQDLIGLFVRGMQPKIENHEMISIGLTFTVLIVPSAFLLSHNSFFHKQKKFFKICFALDLFFVLTCFGSSLPFTAWFYAFVPELGAMHLTSRYLFIAFPIVAICFGCIFQKMEETTCLIKLHKHRVKILLCSVAVLLMVLWFGDQWEGMLYDRLVLEVACAGMAISWLSIRGTFCRTLCGFLMLSQLMLPIQYVLISNDYATEKSTYAVNSIAFHQEGIDHIDSFLDSKQLNKAAYKYVANEQYAQVPEDLIANLPWYHRTEHKLINYFGYEVHLSAPKDYLEKNSWFDNYDWQYLANTRADFAILPYQTAEFPASGDSTPYTREYYEQWIDFEHSDALLLHQNYRIYWLKKYIPTHYTQGELILDRSDVLDNGYFYAPNLNQEHILDFYTDDATEFTIRVNAVEATEMAFLLYPNRNYVYYVDGTPVDACIDNMQAYITIEEGEHTVSVRYENRINQFSLLVFISFYGFCAITLMVHIFHLGITTLQTRSKKRSN